MPWVLPFWSPATTAAISSANGVGTSSFRNSGLAKIVQAQLPGSSVAPMPIVDEHVQAKICWLA
jgi:hypothetical protein